MGYAVDFDGQLYNGLSIGKAEAFASVFDRYHRLLYACLLYTSDAADE